MSDFKILVVSNMYPSLEKPAFGKFVEAQVEHLRSLGCSQDLLFVNGKGRVLKYILGAIRIRERIRSKSYSHIHAYYGLCGFISILQNRVPVVVTYCGSDLNPGYAGRKRSPARSAVIGLLSQLASLRAYTSIVRSNEMLCRLRWKNARKRARIIKSGVDLTRFYPADKLLARQRLGWDESCPVMLFVCADAGLPAVKQPELARAVAEKVKEVLPRARLEIVAGKPQNELPDYYNAADVLLLTSASEGSPNVVKEALACDLPVVSTRVGDLPEFLPGIRNCYVCSNDATELSTRVIEVLRSGRRIGIPQVASEFSLEKTSSAILAVYNEISSQIGQRRDGSRVPEGAIQ